MSGPTPDPARPPGDRTTRCLTCRHELPSHASYCPGCGTALAAAVRRIARETGVRGAWLDLRATVVFCAVYLLAAVVGAALREEDDQGAELAANALMSGVVAVWWARGGTSLAGLFRWSAPVGRWCAAAVAAAIGACIVNYVWHAALRAGTGLEIPREAPGEGPLATAIALRAVLPAIHEEIAFRGLMQTRLSKSLPKGDGTYVAAMLFAAIHFDLGSAPYLFGVGVLLAWFRRRSDSLLPCIVLHLSHNAAVLLWLAGPAAR
ncbi:MAG: hypothetical protein HMLKMBBP_03799 [Planctomycetes bacterium]|nr:hypothetical protein [Planctomycetota bacterium]